MKYPLVDNKGRAGEERPAKGFIHAQIVFLPQPLQQAAAPQFEPLEEGGEVLRGRFLVTVFGANGIRSGDDHNSDAYCKIKWAGELMRKTKVVTSLNPEWNESIQFEAVFLHSKVSHRIYMIYMIYIYIYMIYICGHIGRPPVRYSHRTMGL